MNHPNEQTKIFEEQIAGYSLIREAVSDYEKEVGLKTDLASYAYGDGEKYVIRTSTPDGTPYSICILKPLTRPGFIQLTAGRANEFVDPRNTIPTLDTVLRSSILNTEHVEDFIRGLKFAMGSARAIATEASPNDVLTQRLQSADRVRCQRFAEQAASSLFQLGFSEEEVLELTKMDRVEARAWVSDNLDSSASAPLIVLGQKYLNKLYLEYGLVATQNGLLVSFKTVFPTKPSTIWSIQLPSERAVEFFVDSAEGRILPRMLRPWFSRTNEKFLIENDALFFEFQTDLSAERIKGLLDGLGSVVQPFGALSPSTIGDNENLGRHTAIYDQVFDRTAYFSSKVVEFMILLMMNDLPRDFVMSLIRRQTRPHGLRKEITQQLLMHVPTVTAHKVRDKAVELFRKELLPFLESDYRVRLKDDVVCIYTPSHKEFALSGW